MMAGKNNKTGLFVTELKRSWTHRKFLKKYSLSNNLKLLTSLWNSPQVSRS